MLNKPTKSQGITQAVISTDQNFILAKNINNFTDIISPFKKSTIDSLQNSFSQLISFTEFKHCMNQFQYISIYCYR